MNDHELLLISKRHYFHIEPNMGVAACGFLSVGFFAVLGLILNWDYPNVSESNRITMILHFQRSLITMSDVFSHSMGASPTGSA